MPEQLVELTIRVTTAEVQQDQRVRLADRLSDFGWRAFLLAIKLATGAFCGVTLSLLIWALLVVANS